MSAKPYYRFVGPIADSMRAKIIATWRTADPDLTADERLLQDAEIEHNGHIELGTSINGVPQEWEYMAVKPDLEVLRAERAQRRARRLADGAAKVAADPELLAAVLALNNAGAKP